jgi:hypothetical protein
MGSANAVLRMLANALLTERGVDRVCVLRFTPVPGALDL